MGITRNFQNVAALTQWLDNKRCECESQEEYVQWLHTFFEEGNKIKVNGVDYRYSDCSEIS